MLQEILRRTKEKLPAGVRTFIHPKTSGAERRRLLHDNLAARAKEVKFDPIAVASNLAAKGLEKFEEIKAESDRRKAEATAAAPAPAAASAEKTTEAGEWAEPAPAPDAPTEDTGPKGL